MHIFCFYLLRFLYDPNEDKSQIYLLVRDRSSEVWTVHVDLDISEHCIRSARKWENITNRSVVSWLMGEIINTNRCKFTNTDKSANTEFHLARLSICLNENRNKITSYNMYNNFFNYPPFNFFFLILFNVVFHLNITKKKIITFNYCISLFKKKKRFFHSSLLNSYVAFT